MNMRSSRECRVTPCLLTERSPVVLARICVMALAAGRALA